MLCRLCYNLGLINTAKNSMRVSVYLAPAIGTVDLYSAFLSYLTLKALQAWITQFYLQVTPWLPLPRKRSLDGAISDLWWRPSNCSLLLIYRPRKDERLSWPGWLTYSGRFTHISGHPSAVGRAQRRESSPVKDQLSTTGLRNQAISGEGIVWSRVYYDVCLLLIFQMVAPAMGRGERFVAPCSTCYFIRPFSLFGLVFRWDQRLRPNGSTLVSVRSWD